MISASQAELEVKQKFMVLICIDPFETIVTDRVKLEPLRPSHASSLIMPLRASRLYRYLSEEPPVSVCELKRQFQLWTERPERGLCYVTRDVSNNIALGMVRVSFVGDGRALINCKTFSQFVGHQYSRAAVAAIAKLLAMAGSVVEAHVDTRNIPAHELFRAIGFIAQSVIANADYFQGEPRDEIRYVFPT